MTRKLASLAELARVLSQNGRKAVVQAEAGLMQAAVLIQDDAKNRIGGMGGETPDDWAPLSAATEARKAELGRSDAPLVGSGALRDSIVIEHEGKTVAVGSALDVAAWQEFGTATIPPRPFLGPALMANEEKIVKLVGERAAAALAGEER